MDYQTNIDPIQGSDKLSDNDAELVIKYVLECEKKGREAREKYKADIDACRRAYDCNPDPIEDPELDWQTNIILPWAYDAAESWHAYLHQTMIPKRDEIFTVAGRTVEDHPGAEAMQKYMEYKLDHAGFQEHYGKVLRQLARENHCASKVYWRTDKRTSYVWSEEPKMNADGTVGIVKRKIPQESVVYNGPAFDVIPLDDFIFYPIYGDIEKTTRIHCTHKFLEDIKADAQAGTTPYDMSAINKIQDDTDEQERNYERPENERETKRKFQGVKLKEAWIHRLKMPDGRIFKNYVATIAQDKYLIRFQKNPYEMGKSPFIWLALRPDGSCLYGTGLNSKGIPLLTQASELFNSKMDEVKLRVHPPTAYIEDNIFNPYAVINRPGAFFQVSQDFFAMGGPKPLMQDFTPLQLAFQEIAELKVEFETVTVPKVVKGMIEVQRESTATEQSLAQSNASGKMNADAFHINENDLKPKLQLVYAQLYQKIHEDPSLMEELARLTVPATITIDVNPQTGEPLPQSYTAMKDPEELIQGLPQFLPLPEVDIQVVGYQNQIRKQEQAFATQSFIAGIIQTPAAKYLQWDNVAEIGCELTDLDKDRLVLDQEQRQQVDTNEQQQAEEEKNLLIAQEKMKLDLERFKEESKAAYDQGQLELKRMELELKYNLEMEKLKQGAVNAEADRRAEADSQKRAKSDSGTAK